MISDDGPVSVQGSVMRKYPAVLSMGCLVELFGAMQASVLGFALEGAAFLDVRTITMNHLACILYAVSLLNYCF